MSDRSMNLGTLEDNAYGAAYSDGIIDTFSGVSLMCIGITWIWFPDFAGLAGVIPAVFLTSVLAVRKKVVEPRIGYVKWRGPRRRWEQRNLIALLAAGTLLFMAGIVTFFAVETSSIDSDTLGLVMPGLLAWLLALAVSGLAYLMQMRRLLGYAGLLVVAGAVAIGAEANPGWSLLAAGTGIALTGVVMLVRFLGRNPVIKSG
ncbi:MAG: hypothetical protein GY724_04745 [Actinomycetia bacterium]|nr:hypothetical protein [Actinomycetes bacterium]MCP4224268.1 hypothetical protein [Actinomycetes bacterium]